MAKRRTSPARLLITILVSIFLFIALALGEDYSRRFLDRRQADRAKAAVDAAGGRAVERYVEVLAEAYLKTTPSLLGTEKVATEKQITQVRLFMAYNHFEKKEKLLAELKSQKIDKVRITGGKATVKATETWDYRYLDEATGKIASQSSETLKVDYKLVKVAGDWLVDDLTAKNL